MNKNKHQQHDKSIDKTWENLFNWLMNNRAGIMWILFVIFAMATALIDVLAAHKLLP